MLGPIAHGVHDPQFFRPRGLGRDGNFPCLVTGVHLDFAENLSGFVTSKTAGEKVLAMLGGRARLDYRDYEPNWVQVKIGVAKGHEAVLQRLCDATAACDNIISPRMILWALDPESCPGYEPHGLKMYRQIRAEYDALKKSLAAPVEA